MKRFDECVEAMKKPKRKGKGETNEKVETPQKEIKKVSVCL